MPGPDEEQLHIDPRHLLAKNRHGKQRCRKVGVVRCALYKMLSSLLCSTAYEHVQCAFSTVSTTSQFISAEGGKHNSAADTQKEVA
jgi:hypothetical protein